MYQQTRTSGPLIQAITERPLRFCMVTTFYPPYNFGGDGIFVHRLSNELARRGHSVEVIHCIDSYRLLAGREPQQDFNNHPNVKVHGIKSGFGLVSPLATQQTGLPLFKAARIKKILAEGFDVIHYHNISLIGGPRILAYGSGIKLYTPHDYWLLCPTHLLFKFNRAPCTKRQCFTCELAFKRPPQLWRSLGTLEAGLKHVDAFIASTDFTKQMHQRLGLKAPIVHLPHFVPDSVNDNARTENDLIQRFDTPYFLFVGRLEKLKGAQTLLPIFRRYKKAQLWIAGTGSYEPELRRLASDSPNVRFLGQQSVEQLVALYRNAVAVIVPSVCFEMFSLVVVEAFMQRTPVIVRNIGGMPELVKQSGGGFIYETETELVSAMDRLLDDSCCRRELGIRGYEAFQTKWTTDAHLKRYLALIHDIAAKRGLSMERASLASRR